LTAVCAAIVKAFSIKALSEGSNFPATLILILSYCVCMHCLVYIVEKSFQEPSFGQIVMLTVSVFTGIGTLVIMLLLFFVWWIRPIVKARKLLSVLLLIFPPYALGTLVFIFQEL
jgi:hypothetical protein